MIQIYENRIPPLPTTFEGWDTWTLWDLRNFLAYMLISHNNPDRADPATAGGINLAVASVYDESEWPSSSLGTNERSKKVVLLETLGQRLPREALWSLDMMRNLWATLTHRSASAWEIAGRETRAAVEQVPELAAQAGRKAADIVEKGAPGFGLGLGAIAGLALLFHLGGMKRGSP